MVLLALLTLVLGTTAFAAPELGPRAHVMRTHLFAPAAYEAVAAENNLGLRLIAKFRDGMDIRSTNTGIISHLEASRPHVVEINRTLGELGATLTPVLGGVGPEWESVVARAEMLSGRLQVSKQQAHSAHRCPRTR